MTKLHCPSCLTESARRVEKRWAHGRYQDLYATVHSVLSRCQCRACKHEYLVVKHIPLDPALEPKELISYDWAKWRTAKKKKPGTAQMGTTAGEFTELASKDPAAVYMLLKRYWGQGKAVVPC